MPTLTPKQAQTLTRAIRKSPKFFLRDYLGADPWPMQISIIQSVRDNRVTTVRSCHGIGKSWIAARTAAWFLMAYPNSVVVTTAPTGRQVKEILWREFRVAAKKARYKFPGKTLTTQHEISDKWYAIGVSAKDPDNFQGFHADHILVIVDEAAGVNEPIFEAVDALVTSANARVLYIGNPTSVGGTFYDSHRSHLASKLHVSCWITPNFTENGIARCEAIDCKQPNHPAEAVVEAIESGREQSPEWKTPRPHLVSVRWVYERIFKWGIGTPLWDSRVEGEFPKSGTRALIALNLVEAAMSDERHAEVKVGPSRFGVDSAGGGDMSAIYHRRGQKGESIRAWLTPDTTVINDEIEKLNPTDHETQVKIEAMGLGIPIYNTAARKVRENPHWLHKIIAVNTSNPPTVKDPGPGEYEFANLRAEMWWSVSRLFINGDIAIPDDEELKVELSAVEWYLKNGKIHVEDKKELRKRIGRSPDRGDALVISYAPVEGGNNVLVLDKPETKRLAPETYTSGLLGKQF
ncbi:phage terminase large subunit [Pseudarthrobacter sp. W1I19]|uniref:terminase large subunit domain-containing protein n=1 Tax=Pseudarthrobacter sp. W1I19 TaxID=3042288 RepID=UPI00278531FF|nr:terminase family protein [Pseudarthrobacter sp. W1I19]MDQ0923327.1 phage terminase large subunit [Pseudarthrobacter sp. W1I19]